jgi:beta-glucosidase
MYLRDPLATVVRPVLSLVRWEKLVLDPGESREVRFVLGREDFELLDAEMRAVVEPGVIRLLVGRSSRDARLRGEVVLR